MENSKNLKVFVVDDNLTCLLVYSNKIKKLGYSDVSVFKNSTELLNVLQEKPDVIFLDYNLDHLNGLELLKKIKRFDPNIFVIIVSGQENIPVAVNSLKYGAVDYLTKEEFTDDRIGMLFEKIEQLVEATEARRRNKKLSASLTAAASLAALFFVKPFTQNNGG